MLSLLNSASTSVIQQMMSSLGLNGFSSVANTGTYGMGNSGAIGPGVAGNDEGLMSTWDQTFLPELNSLIADANSYASPARIQQAMGAAEAGVAQAMDQAQQNALRDLQSFGIDPSSGRYAQLDETARLQRAAAQAGAGNVAEQQVEAIGRALRSEAIQATAQLPSQAASMIGANAQVMGVEVQQELGQLNAELEREKLIQQGQIAQEQIAASLIGKPIGGAPQQPKNPNPNAADNTMANIYSQMLAEDARQKGTPSVDQQDQGGLPGQQPQAPQAKQDTAAAGNEMSSKGGGGGTQQGGGQTAAQLGAAQSGQALQSDIDAWNAQQAQRQATQDQQQDQESDQADENAAPTPALPAPDNADVTQNDQAPSWLDTSLENAPLPADSTQLAGPPPTPDTPDTGDTGDTGGAIPTMADQQAAPAPTDSTGELDNTLPPEDGGNTDNTLPPDDGGNTDNTLPPEDNGDAGGGDTGALPPPPTDTGGDSGGSDTGEGDTGGDGGDTGGEDDSFAQGGPVQAVHNRMGAIPASMSPSGGQSTDDVPATLHGTGEQIRLNQGEFIIPRDVVGWRGEGYYQKDIQKARKEREGAVARPTMKPAIPVGGQQ